LILSKIALIVMTEPVDRITLAHGNGGRFMRDLVRDVFARHFGSPALDVSADAVCLPPAEGALVVTTDGFIVDPLEFPGGDIGSLAVHGTVNDLAVSGATPRWLTMGFIIEEGFAMDRLNRIAASIGRASAACGVSVVAGDTKVVPRGQGGGLYIAATGIGIRGHGAVLDMAHIRPGDCVLVSGPVGDHGTAVLLARQEFGLQGDLHSDSASVLPFTRAARGVAGLRFMRDPTRGGIATVANEISLGTGLRVVFEEAALPLRQQVQGICEMLGYDPLYLACEGRVVAVVDPERAAALLAAWRGLPDGRQAAMIGRVETGRPCVVLRTRLGGERLLHELEDDPLPRIC
jgi:hydrogenase expression/formation protein HypE